MKGRYRTVVGIVLLCLVSTLDGLAQIEYLQFHWHGPEKPVQVGPGEWNLYVRKGDPDTLLLSAYFRADSRGEAVLDFSRLDEQNAPPIDDRSWAGKSVRFGPGIADSTTITGHIVFSPNDGIEGCFSYRVFARLNYADGRPSDTESLLFHVFVVPMISPIPQYVTSDSLQIVWYVPTAAKSTGLVLRSTDGSWTERAFGFSETQDPHRKTTLVTRLQHGVRYVVSCGAYIETKYGDRFVQSRPKSFFVDLVGPSPVTPSVDVWWREDRTVVELRWNGVHDPDPFSRIAGYRVIAFVEGDRRILHEKKLYAPKHDDSSSHYQLRFSPSFGDSSFYIGVVAFDVHGAESTLRLFGPIYPKLRLSLSCQNCNEGFSNSDTVALGLCASLNGQPDGQIAAELGLDSVDVVLDVRTCGRSSTVDLGRIELCQDFVLVTSRLGLCRGGIERLSVRARVMANIHSAMVLHFLPTPWTRILFDSVAPSGNADLQAMAFTETVFDSAYVAVQWGRVRDTGSGLRTLGLVRTRATGVWTKVDTVFLDPSLRVYHDAFPSIFPDIDCNADTVRIRPVKLTYRLIAEDSAGNRGMLEGKAELVVLREPSIAFYNGGSVEQRAGKLMRLRKNSVVHIGLDEEWECPEKGEAVPYRYDLRSGSVVLGLLGYEVYIDGLRSGFHAISEWTGPHQTNGFFYGGQDSMLFQLRVVAVQRSFSGRDTVFSTLSEPIVLKRREPSDSHQPRVVIDVVPKGDGGVILKLCERNGGKDVQLRICHSQRSLDDGTISREKNRAVTVERDELVSLPLCFVLARDTVVVSSLPSRYMPRVAVSEVTGDLHVDVANYEPLRVHEDLSVEIGIGYFRTGKVVDRDTVFSESGEIEVPIDEDVDSIVVRARFLQKVGESLILRSMWSEPTVYRTKRGAGGKADELRLLGAFPNPFNSDVNFRISLSQPSRLHFLVYDVFGRIVRGPVEINLPAGQPSVKWDGTDNDGLMLPSGLYICRFVPVKLGGPTFTTKVCLLR